MFVILLEFEFVSCPLISATNWFPKISDSRGISFSNEWPSSTELGLEMTVLFLP
jgi:hypothetical protein